MSNKKGLVFSLDAMLALTLVAMTAVVFVFSLNTGETEKNRLIQVKDEVRDQEALAFMSGNSTEEMGLEGFQQSTWDSIYSFAACEKYVKYDPTTNGLTAQGSIDVNYMCKGVP